MHLMLQLIIVYSRKLKKLTWVLYLKLGLKWKQMGRLVHVAAALVLFLSMLAVTFVTAVRTLEKCCTLVTKDYFPHDILNKKEVYTAEFLVDVEEES